MNRTLLRAALVGASAATLLAPLALIAGVGKPGAHGRLVVFADALGFAALSLIAVQIVSSGTWATRAFGLRVVLALHRQAGIATLVLVVAHVLVLIADDPSRLALLDCATAPPRARAGMAGLVGLGALAATSAWRRRLHLSYERWKGLHLVLTVVVLAAGGWLALILAASFYVRRRIGPKTWRWMHRWTLAVYLLALVHVVGAGTDGCSPC